MRRKNKTNAFCRSVALQRFITIVATLCSFKITELFSFMKAKIFSFMKKSPSDFITKFLLFWSTLKTFDIKQGSPMTEEKEITISM